MKGCIVYLRKSQDRIGQKYSLEAQETGIRTFCEQQGLRIEHIFKDIQSGTKEDRVGLKLAVQVAKSLEMPIVVLRVDRLSRKPSQLFSLLEDPKLKIIVAELGLEADVFLLGQMVLYANLEIELLRRRVKDGMKRAKANGAVFGNPRWKDSVEARRQGKINKANEQAQRLAPIVMPLYAQLGSYSKVAKTLNEMDVKTDRGNAFSHKTVRDVIKRLEHLGV